MQGNHAIIKIENDDLLLENKSEEGLQFYQIHPFLKNII